MSKKFGSLVNEHSRFQSPFIFKFSFYAPNTENRAKNAAHISYIGRRTGVDLGDELQKPENAEYTFKEISEGVEPGSAAGHVKYASERPGSHGLFGATGEKPVLNEIQDELQTHKGVVWRSILSLKEEDAKLLNLDDRKGWETALRAAVPQAAAEMGIGESNLRWVAAFHQEKGHPHVHLVMWEKVPKRRKGRITDGERKDVKNAFMNQIYGGERVRLTQEKTAMRDLIRDLSKGDTEKAVAIIRDVQRATKLVELELQSAGVMKTDLAPKAYPKELKEIVKGLGELARLMPGRGRAALKFMPEPAKTKALEIAEKMLRFPDFRASYDRYMKSAESMTRLHTTNPDKIKAAKDRAHNDLRDRVANVIVRGAAEVNKANASNKASKDASKRSKKGSSPQSKSVKPARPPKMEEQMNVARTVWKSAWNAIEQSRMQNEAQGRIQKAQMARREQQIRQQENERER
ncbi:MobP3 family relaxase [Paenibacillus sp. GCM10012307]|uniref:Relaxase n=1 Tax=Paenibacillus roseus TaxID=2798579 RepID=A0A934IWC6_9BACL|nr:MobP3 family relaxase [Paenibacillus roseus]MBJ6360512.1 hypothetical protein [Paenibacillus roseus]